MNRLKILRESERLSQRELCKVIGVSQGTLSNWERGAHDIDNDSLLKLSEYFGVTTDYLLGKEPIKKAPNREAEGEDPLVTEIIDKLYRCTDEQLEKALDYLKLLLRED